MLYALRISWTLWEISFLAESLISLSMAPRLRIMSETKDSFPTKSCACLTPLSTAGVSEYTVSVATASCLLGILRAGFLDLRCFLMGKVPTDAPHCVVCLKVSLMVSVFTQPKYGLYLSKSGVSALSLC